MTQPSKLLLASFHICVLLAVAKAQYPGTTTLQLGIPLERSLTVNQADRFTVDLKENSYVQVVVDQQGIDAIVRVSSPDGRSLGEFDSPNGASGPENVSFVAVSAGAYEIVVTPLERHNEVKPGRYQIKLIEVREATEEEIKSSRNHEVLKAKGLALLDEIDRILPEIRAPQTRIGAQVQAEQLWREIDEKRASKYLADAVNGVREYIASIDPNSPPYVNSFGMLTQIRYEIARALARRDVDGALDFLRSTRLHVDPFNNRREQMRREQDFELSIANEWSSKDPQRALKVARETLKRGFSGNLIGTVAQLTHKHPESAAELAREIAAKLMAQELLKNGEAANLAMNLLRMCLASRHGQNTNTSAPAPLPSQTCRDLFEKTSREALSYSPPPLGVYSPERDAAWNILHGLKSLEQQLDTLITGGAATVEKKLAEFNFNTYRRGFPQYENTIATASVENALEAIQKAPEEQRDQLYLQLSGRFVGEGDFARARQIVNERVFNPYQKRQALTNLDQQEMQIAASRNKTDEALKIIATLRTPRERAQMLMQIANQIGAGQKKPVALMLLEQARSLLSPTPQAPDQDQMNAMLEIARAFSRYDSKRAFEIVEPLVEQFNDLCTAARVMQGFGYESYEDDELNMQSGNLSNVSSHLSNALATLATNNFEGAKSIADRVRLPEVRLRMYLDIARQAVQGTR